MTKADLPDPHTTRWLASRKLAVVRGVLYGLISQDEAMKLYALSAEEFQGWVVALRDHGVSARKATVQRKSS